MKFIISKASDWNDWNNEQPHPKAYPEMVTEHVCCLDGTITKTVQKWFIELETLEDLKELSDNKCNRFIIDFEQYDNNYPLIIIDNHDWI